jgi:hypothetical protein
MRWALIWRRQEELDPWDKKSTFFELAMKNKTLKEALPKQLALTTRNTDTHIYSKPSKCYVTIHALLTLSTIALYREYLAFAPWLEKGPVGPIDEPKVQGKPPYKDYWVDQARNCFGACKDFADLLQACRKADKFVESPITGWTTYIVAWCGESFIPPFSCFTPKAKSEQLYTATFSPKWIPTERFLLDLRPLYGNLLTTSSGICQNAIPWQAGTPTFSHVYVRISTIARQKLKHTITHLVA